MSISILLLAAANVFMTLAWYWHLKFAKGEHESLPKIIAISWGIALFEYCLQVPANRIGYKYFEATQLKIIQEVISITVFIAFATLVLGERMKWNYAVAFALIILAVYFAVAVKS